MDCENATQFLPWLLNGSLDATEEREVRDHLASCADCQSELAETFAAGEVFGAHLPSAVLVDLAFGRPVEEIDAELVEQHLAECADCAEQLALVRESADRAVGAAAPGPPPLPFPAERPTAPHASRGWRYAALAASLAGLVSIGGWMWSAMSASSLATSLAAERSQRRERTAALDSQVAHLREELAAVGREASAGQGESGQQAAALEQRIAALAAERDRLEAQAAELGRRLADLSSPQLNVAIVDVYSTQVRQRGEGAPERDPVPRDPKPVTVILNPAPGVGDAPVDAEIVDATGKVLLRLSGLRLNPTNDFSFDLPTAGLPAGAATINLYRPGSGGGRSLVDSFQIELR
jgi:Putative zinc-finger